MSYRIQQRIGVAAPASAVWQVVAEFDAWAKWNPLFTSAEGRLSIGASVTFHRAAKGRSVIEQVRVIDWVPSEQLVWTRSIAPFASAVGYIEIEALSERGCIVAVGEIYNGLIGSRIGQYNRKSLRPGYAALCEALKTRAESTWDGVPDARLPPPVAKPTKAVKQGKPATRSVFGRRG